MLKIAKASAEERRALFHNTATKLGLTDAIVEKDFWVCWTLDYLFHSSIWKERLTFKGGTSLSKCYGLIKRFSEDIDLILDWSLLGCKNNEPWVERTHTAQERYCNEINERTSELLASQLVPALQADFAKLLNSDFAIRIDDEDPQTINFDYPKCFETSYILNTIRLEIGALAAWTPSHACEIRPYAAEQYGRLFEQPSTSVLTVSAERTFWEKITILHKEACRANGMPPSRYSRHYYDIYCMAQSPVKAAALADLPLLQQVVDFKTQFYYSNAAHYEFARPGTMRLVPPDNCISALRDDYVKMKDMFFGPKPTFEDLMVNVQNLELEINQMQPAKLTDPLSQELLSQLI